MNKSFHDYLEALTGRKAADPVMTIHIPDWLSDIEPITPILTKYKLKLVTKMRENNNGNFEFDIKGKRSDLQNWIDDYYQTGDPDSDNPEFYLKSPAEKRYGGAEKIITAYKDSPKSKKIKGWESSENFVIFNTTLPQKVYRSQQSFYSIDNRDKIKNNLKGHDRFLSYKISQRGDGKFEVRSSNSTGTQVEYQATLQRASKKKFDTADEAVGVMLFYIKKAS